MIWALWFWRLDPVRSGAGFKSLLNVEKNMMKKHGLITVLEDQRIAPPTFIQRAFTELYQPVNFCRCGKNFFFFFFYFFFIFF